MVRRCPLCHQQTDWEDNPWIPFCSERCQMIDLGRWAEEEYRVPLDGMPERLDPNFDREEIQDEQV